MNTIRPSWDTHYMNLVADWEKMSVCLHYQVGCVFRSPDNVTVASGFNAPPKEFPHCQKVGCNKDRLGYCIGAHAEINALTFCVGSPFLLLKNATLYSSLFPCRDCMKTLVNCGISRIVFREWYFRRNSVEGTMVLEPHDQALAIAQIAGIKVEQYCPKTQTTTPIVEYKER